MKHILLATAILVLSTQAHAIITDRFTCNLEVRDISAKTSMKQKQDLAIARLPATASLPGTPADVKFTSGNALLETKLQSEGSQINASVHFYYKHATRINANGELEARQSTCVAVSGDYCALSSNAPTLCGSTVLACSESANPFDPYNGWAVSPVTGDIPAFNERMLNPQNISITEKGVVVGNVNLACQFLGTYQ